MLAAANLRDELFRLGRRLGVQFRREMTGELLVGIQRTGAVTEAIEEFQYLPHASLVVARELYRAAGEGHGGRELARLFAIRGEPARSIRHEATQSRALALQPLLECRRRVGIEAWQELTRSEERRVGKGSRCR